MRRFYACTFKPGGRAFTYHHDGDQPFAPGDRVQVPAARNDGWTVVTVEGVSTTPPPFETKAILGAAEEGPPPDAQAKAIGGLFSAEDSQ